MTSGPAVFVSPTALAARHLGGGGGEHLIADIPPGVENRNHKITRLQGLRRESPQRLPPFNPRFRVDHAGLPQPDCTCHQRVWIAHHQGTRPL